MVDLTKEINKILSEYGDEVNEVVEQSAKDVGKETVKMLKRTSPKSKTKKKRRYAQTWKQKTVVERLGTHTVIYNDKNYMLTHLLENGHYNRDGSFTKGTKHIKAAEEMAVDSFIDKVVKGL